MRIKSNYLLATTVITLNIMHMIIKKRGKGTAINEVRNKRTPDDTRFADNYDNIFRKPAATPTKLVRSKTEQPKFK